MYYGIKDVSAQMIGQDGSVVSFTGTSTWQTVININIGLEDRLMYDYYVIN